MRNRDKFLFRKRETDFFPEDTVEYTGEQGADVFTRMLAKAEQERDYVLAIRVNYSALLQMLDKKEVIRWDISKTNQCYIHEIKNETWNCHFREISRIFDCVCYGEFPVDEIAYRNIKRYLRTSERRWKDETTAEYINHSFCYNHDGGLHGVRGEQTATDRLEP